MITLASLFYRLKYRAALTETTSYLARQAQKILQSQKSVFVFANGPSMADIDLAKVGALCATGRFDIIAINSYLSRSAELAKPTFAVFADNLYFAGSSPHHSSDIEVCEKLGIPYFVPAKFWRSGSNLQRAFCSLVSVDRKNTSDITRPAGYYGMTAFFALSLAKSLPYQHIYICGFDNSYFRDFAVTAEGKIGVPHVHYYDNPNEPRVSDLYKTTSEFFFDTYRHFHFLERIAQGDSRFFNVALSSFLNTVPRDISLDIYSVKPELR